MKKKLMNGVGMSNLLKVLKIMRLSVFLLMVFALQTWASSTYSQQTHITLNLRNVKLLEVLNQIENSTSFYFLFNKDLVDVDRIVSVSADQKKVDEVLTELFAGTNVKFFIADRQIVLSTEKAKESQPVQQRQVSGKVTDSSGVGLPGVTVFVKGTTTGTITDGNGNYSLAKVPSDAILVFSFVGMKTQEIPVAGQPVINLSMTEEQIDIEEIVAIGYGVQRKSDITGAIASIKSDELLKTNTANVMDAIQGKVSGVMVEANGAPGSSPIINIRGIGTTNDSSPLFVVDGMLLSDISYLNNNDIESMEVLKDASSTAIYGSRGANGVILITTKKGKEGHFSVNLKANQGVQFQNSPFEVCNAAEYGQLLNEALVNSGSPKKFEDPESLGKGTNWLDEAFRNAPVHDYQLSMNGGTNKVLYNISIGNFHQDGIVKKNSFDRTTIRLNNIYKLSDKLTVGHNISGSFSTTKNENTGVITAAYRSSPALTVYDSEGNFTSPSSASSSNLVATLKYLDTRSKTERLVGNSYLEWEIINGLQFKSNFGIDLNYVMGRTYSPKYFISDYQKNLENSLSKTWTRHFTWLWENTVSWDKTFSDIHRLNVLGGITAQNYDRETLGASGRNFFTDDPNYTYVDQAAADSKSGTNNASSESIASYLFRVNYALKDRYLLTATFRADGSSKFGPDNRWGYFPSAAAGWRISEEDFIRNNFPWLNNLKIRGSWGQIGNDKIANYQYAGVANMASTFDAVFNGIYYPGGTITSLYNRAIHWEASEQTDLGMDISVLKNKLTAEIDYYIRDTKDMLVTVNVPAQVGLSAVDTNVGEVRNKGFDFTLRWNHSVKDFTYNIRFTGTTIKNEVTKLGKDIPKGDVGSGLLVTMTREGYPIGSFYGYETIGIFQSPDEIDYYNSLPTTQGQKYQNFSGPAVAPGDLIYADLDGDGMVRAAQDRTFIGNPTPDFIGGLNISMEWRGFDLSFDFQGTFGNDIFNSKIFERYGGDDNYSRAFLDRWTTENTNTDIPRMTTGGNNYQISSRWLQDGSYIKLQTAELGYTLPKSVLNRLKIQNARVYVSGNNLFYITDYDGLTPEISKSNNLERGIDRAIYPVTSSARFGINLTF
jgi:TonB-linked SusC/RagA family outer membrane protein